MWPFWGFDRKDEGSKPQVLTKAADTYLTNHMTSYPRKRDFEEKVQFSKQQSEAPLCNTCEYFPKSKTTTEEAQTPNWAVMEYNRIQFRVAVFS